MLVWQWVCVLLAVVVSQSLVSVCHIPNTSSFCSGCCVVLGVLGVVVCDASCFAVAVVVTVVLCVRLFFSSLT